MNEKKLLCGMPDGFSHLKVAQLHSFCQGALKLDFERSFDQNRCPFSTRYATNVGSIAFELAGDTSV
jgi:hypothetical protein